MEAAQEGNDVMWCQAGQGRKELPDLFLGANVNPIHGGDWRRPKRRCCVL